MTTGILRPLPIQEYMYSIQWNPFITDTIGTQHYVRYSEVSLTQRLPVYFRYMYRLYNEVEVSTGYTLPSAADRRDRDRVV